MKKVLLIAVIALTVMSATAQLRVKPQGYLLAGPDSLENVYINSATPSNRDTITAIKIYSNGPYGAGGRLSFGDQGILSNMNVLIGELGNGVDTDMLWLHGKRGFGMTMNHSVTDTLMTFNPHIDTAIRFGYPIKAQGVLLSSDARLKENIRPLESALSTLAGVNGVTYNLKRPYGTMRAADCGLDADQDDILPKDKKDREFFKNFYAQKDTKSHYGFIAQELKEVLPDLVYTDKNGYMSVDYIGLIPILVNAVNELSAELAELKAEKQDEETPSTSNSAPTDNGIEGSALLGERVAEVLSQNDPNPFSSDTRIGYNLPDGTQQAAIYIYDLQGKQVKRLNVDARDNSVTLQGGDLQAGMYIYSLIADGKELASKKMILTK